MKTTTAKRWMPPGRSILAILTLLLLHTGMAFAWEPDDYWVHESYADGEGTVYLCFACEECGARYGEEQDYDPFTEYASDIWSEIEDNLMENFCEECGYCSENGNDECYKSHHCTDCGACLDDDESYDLGLGFRTCDSCWEGLMAQYPEYFCYYCTQAFRHGAQECGCTDLVVWHCTDCSEVQCENCGGCMVVAGEETYLAENACMEHNICGLCLEGDLGEDGIHCPECHNCDQEICSECGLCEGCYMDENHCPECDFCFGYGNNIQWCLQDGEHCIHCCEDNDWICGECGDCVEASGKEICDDCGLCEECCNEKSEDSGCTHGYCIMSGDYEEHACPECGTCPEDTECPDCMLCEDCQQDYHCEHEICPESSEWDEHLCSDCGDCFEPDELCEFCGKCEDCADDYHCEHGYCPDDSSFEDDFDHFICQQCGDCYEGFDRCEYCELCNDCCSANISSMGCDHDFCVESEDFAEHWCYEDEQCLEKCNHNADCAHNSISSEWESDGKAHWKVCEDCGAAVNKAIHTEGQTVTVSEPNALLHLNGTANVYCAVCEQFAGTVSIPYVPIPEDGSPYIIDQPKNYEGKVSDVANNEVPRYATFSVKAGGSGLTYQWYWYRESYNVPLVKLEDIRGDQNNYNISGKDEISGAKTNKLTVFVVPSACYEKHEYYCVITNAKGQVETVHAKLNAQHTYGWYMDNGDGTHSYHCNGDGCEEVKSNSKHRFGEWTLIRPATDTQTGLYEQKCQDCLNKKQTVIPKVEPGHTHKYDQPRYNNTEHWFACKCGVLSPATREAHLWDKTVVTQPATEKHPGQKEITCTKCGMTKTEKIDKLPHTHVWYTLNDNNMWIQQSGKAREPNPKYWGRYSDYHFFRCKSCDAVRNENHAWMFWSVKATPTSDNQGAMSRTCSTCNYREYKTFPNGTYPILMVGATADKHYARPGETVTITYDPIAAQYGNGDDSYPYPVKLKKWHDLRSWDGSSDIPYGNSWITVPRTVFSNPTAQTTTFVMPNGPATVHAEVEECHHTREGWNDQMNPTCTLYGHKRDRVCLDCGKVTIPGQPIAPLGHVLSNTPVPGTKQTVYCTNYIAGVGKVTDTSARGYSGDFICTRCNLSVRGKAIPVAHGYYDTRTGSVINYNSHWENEREETCTSDGYYGDRYCDHCGMMSDKGYKLERLGHDWGEWTVIREATTRVKGMEQRVCARDESHKETRVTDYSGPDYRLKADKTKLVFEYTYGKPIAPQTVTFTSVGRNPITSIQKASDWELGCSSISVIGMRVTIKPTKDLDWMMAGEQEVVGVDVVNTQEGQISSENITAPSITYTIKFNKGTLNLLLPNKVYITRPGKKFMSPTPRVNHTIANVKVKWTSSDNSVATVNPETGEVTPLSGGDVKIYANFEGDRYYKSEKVYYQLTVIGEQEFAGNLWQIYLDRTGEKQVTDPVANTLKIKPAAEGGGKVDVSFSSFTFVQGNTKLPGINVPGVNVYDFNDGSVIYDMPSTTALNIVTINGILLARGQIEGIQGTPTGQPIMMLQMSTGRLNTLREYTIVFGPEGSTLKEVLMVYDRITGIDEIKDNNDDDAIYDLSGRKLEAVKQSGIYIKGGKKILVK